MEEFKPEKELKSIFDTFDKSLHENFIETKTVLGIDIYKYSEFPSGEQEYIPVLFNHLYAKTVSACFQDDYFLFQFYLDKESDFKSHFISTGDGGFQIFDNPIQAIIFSCYFQISVQVFNSGNSDDQIEKNLFSILKSKIELRYAITTDKIYRYDNNFYGAAIINNARILSKDSLNRLLIDRQSVDWFNKEINSIETIISLNKINLKLVPYFHKYDFKKTSLFFDVPDKNSTFNSIDLLKIGTLKSKNTLLDVYNLRIQFLLSYNRMTKFNVFVITLGNLNTQGIEPSI